MPNVNDKLATIMQGIDNVSPESRAQFVSDALAAAGRAAAVLCPAPGGAAGTPVFPAAVAGKGRAAVPASGDGAGLAGGAAAGHRFRRRLVSALCRPAAAGRQAGGAGAPGRHRHRRQ